MTALQMEFTFNAIAWAKLVVGVACETSGIVPTEKTREDEMPSLVITLAS